MNITRHVGHHGANNGRGSELNPGWPLWCHSRPIRPWTCARRKEIGPNLGQGRNWRESNWPWRHRSSLGWWSMIVDFRGTTCHAPKLLAFCARSWWLHMATYGALRWRGSNLKHEYHMVAASLSTKMKGIQHPKEEMPYWQTARIRLQHFSELLLLLAGPNTVVHKHP